MVRNPHFAATKPDGSFKIKNVPAENYTLKVWNERKKGKPVKMIVRSRKTPEISPKVGKWSTRL